MAVLIYNFFGSQVINDLVRIRSRDGPAAVHQAEFLWASEGDVLTGDEFGHLLERFTKDECGVEINCSSWQQIVTEMMHVYSTHHLPDGNFEGVNIHDARMGHSSRTSHAHYGSRDKNMVTDELLNFRDASLDLHQLLGLGPAGDLPLVPCKLRGRQAMGEPPVQPGTPGIGGPSLQEIAAVFVGVLHDFTAPFRDMIKEETNNGVASAVVALGLNRALPSHHLAHSPTLKPLDLPIIQPTENFNTVPPATAPASGSNQVPAPHKWNPVLLNKLGKTAKFNSFQQHDTIRLALEGRTSFLALLCLGEGKIILYQLPTFLKRGKIIVICPRRALLFDQMKRAEDLHIAYFHWTASDDQVPRHT